MNEIKEKLEDLGYRLSSSGYGTETHSKVYHNFKLSVQMNSRKLLEAMVGNKSDSGATVWYYVTLKNNPSIEWITEFDKLMTK